MYRTKIFPLFVVSLLVLILVSPVNAQSNLEPNVTRTNEHIWGYESATYEASLTSGTWTVIVTSDSFWGLKVRLTVAYDLFFTDIIAQNGDTAGNYPSIEFELDDDAIVYIMVEENSVYGDTSGFYDIGVYDAGHVLGARVGSFLAANWFPLIFAVPFIFMICCAIIGTRRGRGPAARRLHQRRTFRMDAPRFAIPDEHRGTTRSDGSEMTTVRIPNRCPQCAASLSQGDVDWVGPLEAKCNYCGGVVRATFERV
ncbi:MAG: hypothetical protein ACFE7R_06470 [Candidatus Hodarchaeota archaeon]